MSKSRVSSLQACSYRREFIPSNTTTPRLPTASLLSKARHSHFIPSLSCRSRNLRTISSPLETKPSDHYRKASCLMTAPSPTLVCTLIKQTTTTICRLTRAGDKRGPRSSVYDLCHPTAVQEAVPYFSSTEASRSWTRSEMEYLRDAGVFETLAPDVSDGIVHCYFEQVHFVMPILDAPAFLNEYSKNGCQNLNLLLYWSLVLAATNVSCVIRAPSSILIDHVPVCQCRRNEESRLRFQEGHEDCDLHTSKGLFAATLFLPLADVMCSPFMITIEGRTSSR